MFAVISVVLGALLTIASFAKDVSRFVHSNYFVAQNVSEQIRPLFAGQSIEYFQSILGPQLIQREVSEKYTEYIFRYKTAYIQALTRKPEKEVIFWAVTYCGSEPMLIQRPMFSMGGYSRTDGGGKEYFESMLSEKLYLGKSSIKDFYKSEHGEFKYFISGATANSSVYESLYLGNPGAYQTVFLGINDICPFSESSYSYSGLSVYGTSTEEEIEKFRKEVSVNTYAETSPLAGDEVLPLLDAVHSDSSSVPYLDFGVDRIRVRYFDSE